jgi:hypothetical protein
MRVYAHGLEDAVACLQIGWIMKIAGTSHVDRHIRADGGGPARHHQDSVGQLNGFLESWVTERIVFRSSCQIRIKSARILKRVM